MSRDKQIEEMAHDICTWWNGYCCTFPIFGKDELPCTPTCNAFSTAENLIDKGYRKASDVAREIFEEIEEALDGELDREDERERIAWMESDMREHAIHHYAGDKIETLMTAFDLLKKKYESEGEG